MSSNTSIGRGPAHGSNENHDGDPCNKTLGEKASQDEPPAGNELIGEAAPDLSADVPGARPRPGVAKGPATHPDADGPDVGAGPWEPDAARGKPPKA